MKREKKIIQRTGLLACLLTSEQFLHYGYETFEEYKEVRTQRKLELAEMSVKNCGEDVYRAVIYYYEY